jgi:osmotically-inducible protein OsmY
MKALFFFVVGVFAGAYAVHVYDSRWPQQQASAARDAAADRLREWHLGADDIRSDLAQTGQVVREKAGVVGERIGDVRIATVIKAKFVIDGSLQAGAIGVAVDDGAVTLTGSVPSTEAVGRATALALDTAGVRTVTARLTVRPSH